MNLLQTTLKEICEKNKQEKQLSKNKNSAEKKNIVETEKNNCVVVVPPPPQTYIQLKQDWAYLQSNSKLLFQYLKVKYQLYFKINVYNNISFNYIF